MMAGTPADQFDEIVHRPSREFVESTNVWQFMQAHEIDTYEELIAATTTDPERGVDWFWDVVIDELDLEFATAYEAVRDDSDGPQFTEWYPGGELNIAHNAVDRYGGPGGSQPDAIACLWEGEPGDRRELTYGELYRESNRVANALERRGIEPGETVGLYMPMVPEVVSILYGCFKVGAIVVPIFSGFGVDATRTRLRDADCSLLFTADGFFRRGRPIELKQTVDAVLADVSSVEHTIVLERIGSAAPDSDLAVPWEPTRDDWWATAIDSASPEYDTRIVPATHESMLLYSSGTTGTPKGIVQTHAGALVQAAKEIYFGFDFEQRDRFFWVSDIGWMMGPWTLIGNHAHGGTVFLYEGAPDHPEPDRFWELIDRYDITVFGVSPTAIRALRKHGDDWVAGHDLSSLRLLGSTGEPWDPESWCWFYDEIGNKSCPIINISGGTEIMGCFLMPMPIQSLKPCTLGGPGLGMDIDIVDASGTSIADTHERGYLVARDSCPSMTKSLWSGDDRYLAEYWDTWDDLWDHGDFARKDEDGFWFLLGRADDVINVAGRKVGPAEVEGAAIEHAGVSQASAVGVPDDTTGSAVVLFVVPHANVTPDETLRSEIRETIGAELGKPFRPRDVHFVDDLPKTQSGKILRRAIQAVYRGEEPGDLSSIQNPAALEAVENRG